MAMDGGDGDSRNWRLTGMTSTLENLARDSTPPPPPPAPPAPDRPPMIQYDESALDAGFDVDARGGAVCGRAA